MENKPTIFISYSHRDKAYADKLLRHLKVIEERVHFDVWSDREIKPGESLETTIIKHIEQAQLAILLISADYLSSEWISQQELPAILKKQSERGLRVIPLIVSPALWKLTPLAYYQLLPRDGVALSQLPAAAQDMVLVELVDEVVASLYRPKSHDLAASMGSHGKKIRKSISKFSNKNIDQDLVSENTIDERLEEARFFISHSKEDGDFAENLKNRLKEKGFLGWIDTDVLEAGVDWRQEIDDAILGSKGVILILSPESKKSEYVTYEWAFALGLGLKIVPLLLKETPIHPRLEVFQYLDFTNRRARPWDRLLFLLREVANKKHTSNIPSDKDREQ